MSRLTMLLFPLNVMQKKKKKSLKLFCKTILFQHKILSTFQLTTQVTK